jgi:hypothetical protein
MTFLIITNIILIICIIVLSGLLWQHWNDRYTNNLQTPKAVEKETNIDAKYAAKLEELNEIGDKIAEKSHKLNDLNEKSAALGQKMHQIEENIAILEKNAAEKRENVAKEEENLKRLLEEMRSANLRAAADFVGHGNQIQLSEIDKADIKKLRVYVRGMKCESAVCKAIWECYYRDQFISMIKNSACDGVSGIYRIYYYPCGSVSEGNEFSEDMNTTNKKSAAISYIGQSVNIGDRWIQHGKRALGLDPLAGIKLYEVMRDKGIENFYWEVVEVVKDKELLGDREKYWGDFYCCKENGLNKKLG